MSNSLCGLLGFPSFPPGLLSLSCLPAGCAHDPATGEPEVPVSLQEEVHHTQGQEEAEDGRCPALTLPHPHQWQRTLHQVAYYTHTHTTPLQHLKIYWSSLKHLTNLDDQI